MIFIIVTAVSSLNFPSSFSDKKIMLFDKMSNNFSVNPPNLTGSLGLAYFIKSNASSIALGGIGYSTGSVNSTSTLP